MTAIGPVHRILVAVVLGLTTTVALTLALAAWMPLAMYPRQTVYHFVSGGRPWSAAERVRLGVRNLWWSEINADSALPPRPPRSLSSSLSDLVRPPKVEDRPALPSTPEAWVAFARESLAGRTDVALRNNPPWWGTFASGGIAHPGASSATDHAFGWPLPALWYHVHGVISNNIATATAIEGGILLTPRRTLEVRGYDFRALPLWVVWPGLLADTAFYAAIWWLALTAPGVIRGAIRRRRGHCPACGYDLRGTHNNAPCPECGAATLARPAALQG